MQQRQEFDLAVVGAGSCGAAVAYEAASRGMKVFLADKGDFGSGTSANSLKIVHGGLRYLQKMNFARARASSRERSCLLRIAPDLVEPLQFAIPTGWQRGKSRLLLGAGLALNAAVTADRNRRLQQSQHLPAGGLIKRSELGRLAPSLYLNDADGGACWFDGLMRDSERLCLAFVMSAREAGANVQNYVSVDRVLQSGGSAAGIAVRDLRTGEEAEIRARAVVSCQGPWTHVSDGDSSSRVGAGMLKAVNLVLPDTELKCAVGFPVRTREGRPTGGRLLFAVPWHGLTMVGTWYFESTDEADRLSISSEELSMMLDELNRGYGGWEFRDKDVLMFHVGQQPVGNVRSSQAQPIESPVILDSEQLGGPQNSWVVQGEKWTTARATAQKVVEAVARRSGFELAKSETRSIELHCGPSELADCTWRSEALVRGDLESLKSSPLGESLRYSLRHELVRTLPDLVLRRTNIGCGGRPSPEITDKLSRLASAELGWGEDERLLNVDAVNRHAMYPGG